MIRIWPWTKFDKLERQIAWHEMRCKDYLFRNELYQTMAFKAMHELAAANKGIRRLRERLKRYEKKS